MTSEYMKEATEGFMDKNNFFGLDVENVVLFEQGHLPSLTFDGKIIMESRSKVVFSPGELSLYLLCARCCAVCRCFCRLLVISFRQVIQMGCRCSLMKKLTFQAMKSHGWSSHPRFFSIDIQD